MAHNAVPGRHRAAGRYNPLSEVGLVLNRTARPVVKSSAVLAASGGLVAALALPAQAATATSPSSPAKPAGSTAPKAAAALPAVTAPATPAPSAGQAFGVSEVGAVAKPKPKPKPKPVAQAVALQRSTPQAASRSATRTSVAAPRTYTSTKPAAGGVIGVAQSLLGIYYVYGGSTPAGFDCSGFTSYVFRQVGISLPRTAAQQQAATTRVSSPQVGDLVFFGYPAYHVGIYAGNGMMYDSPTTGKTTGLHKIWSSVTYGRP